MQVMNELIDLLGLNLIESCETFPQLLQLMCYAFLGCAVVVYSLRAVFAMNAQISGNMLRR